MPDLKRWLAAAIGDHHYAEEGERYPGRGGSGRYSGGVHGRLLPALRAVADAPVYPYRRRVDGKPAAGGMLLR